MTLDRLHEVLWPHGLTLVYTPHAAPDVWLVVPHPFHHLGAVHDVGEYVPVIVACGPTPEAAFAEWREGLQQNN